MRSVFLFLALLFLSFVSQAQEFKVMTFNIYHGENPSKMGESNFDEVVNLIIQKQPEVIALQEVDSMTGRSTQFFEEKVDMMYKFMRETGYRSYFAKAMDYDGGGYGEGLLMKKRLENKTQNLSNPEGGEPRAVAWAKIELKTEEELYFGGTHLCHEFEGNRMAQMKELFSYADSLDRAAFIAGDFNFDPESTVYDSIPSHWKDAGEVAGVSDQTFAGENGKRIDYVFFDSRYFELVDYQVIKIDYSDHYPVLVTLRLIGQKPTEEMEN